MAAAARHPSPRKLTPDSEWVEIGSLAAWR
jgi:hypothetical protein